MKSNRLDRDRELGARCVELAVQPLVLEMMETRLMLSATSGQYMFPVSHILVPAKHASAKAASWVQTVQAPPAGSSGSLLPSGRIYRPTAAPSGISVTQIRHLYGVDTLDAYDPSFPLYTNLGDQQSIVVIGSAVDVPNDTPLPNGRKSDVNIFSAAMGIDGANVIGVDESLVDPLNPAFDGFNTLTTGGDVPVTDQTGAVETMMQLEWAHAMAPGATLYLVEVPSTEGVVAVDDLAKGLKHAITILQVQTRGAIDADGPGGVITTGLASAGFIPGDQNKIDNILLARTNDNDPSHAGDLANHYLYVTNNISIVAPTGDFGGQKYVGVPSISPYVTAVGGTVFRVDAAGNRLYESASLDSTGGVAPSEQKPAYQSGIRVGRTAFNARAVPDISLVSTAQGEGLDVFYNPDPTNQYLTTQPQSWFQETGTSVSAPIFAGMTALANEMRATFGESALGIEAQDVNGNQLPAPIDELNTLLYQAYNQNRTSNFFDITTGNNISYKAVKGYDFATGLGSPKANALIPTLAGTKASARSNFAFSGTFNTPFNQPPVTITSFTTQNAIATIGPQFIGLSDGTVGGGLTFHKGPFDTSAITAVLTVDNLITRGSDNSISGTGTINVTETTLVNGVVTTTTIPLNVAIVGKVIGKGNTPHITGQIYTLDRNGNRLLRTGGDTTFEGTF